MPTCSQCELDRPEAEVKLGICEPCFTFGPPKKVIDLGPSAESAHERAPQPRLHDLILTTSSDVPGREIGTVISIVATEAAIGMNVLREIASNRRHIVGGRAAASQTSLREARLACLNDLQREAAMVGADAVIAVDLDYNEISTQGSGGILFVAASGTAVTLKPAA